MTALEDDQWWRRDWLGSLTPAGVGSAGNSPQTAAAGEGRTFNYSVTSAAAAAELYSRIRRADDLLNGATTSVESVPDVVLPGSAFVVDADAGSELDERGYRIPQEGTVPNPGQAVPPEDQQLPTPQPEPQPQPNPTADGNPLYEDPLPIPGGPSEPQQPISPPTTLLDMPDTTGLKEGATWNGTMLDGRQVRYTIPRGNGNNTVDLEITNADGSKDYWRIARNAQGGLQHWHDDADGNSSYAYRATAEANWYIQSFAPGVSTFGAPSHELGATPDFETTFTPSFDSEGARVGTDIGKANQFGFYDNYHVDNYGNLTIVSVKPDGKGGIESSVVDQLDRNSWRFGEDGHVWEIGHDLQGRPTAGRTYETGNGRHVLYINHLGELFDSFYGFGSNSTSYTDRITPGRGIVRTYRNGPRILFDKNHIVESVEYPEDYGDPIVAAWRGALNAGKNWVSETFGLNDLRDAYLSSRANAPYEEPGHLERWAKFSDGISGPLRAVGDAVVDPYLTVADWSGRRILAGAFSIGSSFGNSKQREARRATAQELLAESPSNEDAALSAGMLLLPQLGPAIRGLSLGIRVGGRGLADGFVIASRQLGSAAALGKYTYLGVTPARNALMVGQNTIRSGANVVLGSIKSAATKNLALIDRTATRLIQDIVAEVAMYERALVGPGWRNVARNNDQWIAARFHAVTGPATGGIVKPPWVPPVGPVQVRTSQIHRIIWRYGTTAGTRGKQAEFRAQIAGQIAAINKMTANEILHNYKYASRSKTAQDKARKLYRSRSIAREVRIASRMSPAARGGMTPKQYAESIVDKRMAGKAALHEPDLAGGGADVIPLGSDGLPKLGDASVNSSIGSQWRGRRRRALKAYARSMVAAGEGNHLMNVQWIVR